MWVFVLILNLPSFNGEVTVTVRANGWEACDRLRRVVMQHFGGEHNIKGSVTQCTLLIPEVVPQETKP